MNFSSGTVDLTLSGLTLTGGRTTGGNGSFSDNASTFNATWDVSTLDPSEAAFYTYRLDASSITGSGLALDGSSDGTGGDDFVAEHYVAIPGDLNLDGRVDVFGDGFAFRGNIGLSSGALWANGDFNGDGQVDIFGDSFPLLGSIGQDVHVPMSAPVSTASSASNTAPVAVATDAAVSLPISDTIETDDERIPNHINESPLSVQTQRQLMLAGDQSLRDEVFGSDF